MLQTSLGKKLSSYQFPQQKILCDNKLFSNDLLHSLLDQIYAANPPFTGYLKLEGVDCPPLFLFFFHGAPYAAGKYTGSKPVCYSIQKFARELVKSAEKPLSITLCETDPVLLKNMLLFLQEEPDIKAPTTLIDFKYIVRQLGEVGGNAMIALCLDNKVNFYFFRDGKGLLAHYSDLAFKRPDGIAIEEEMMLYAFQPGGRVQTFIFRDMITPMSDDSSQLDKDSFYTLLTVGYLKNRRRNDPELSLITAEKGIEPLVKADHQKLKFPMVILSAESGFMAGDRFTVTLPCTIGRQDCDLILKDRLVSRRHAEIRIVENKLVIEDLASTNGTRVNGNKITINGLAPNDLISIGPTNLRVSPA